VEVVGFQVQHVGICQQVRKAVHDGLAIFFTDTDIDCHASSSLYDDVSTNDRRTLYQGETLYAAILRYYLSTLPALTARIRNAASVITDSSKENKGPLIAKN
jgi:hypothetical protein